MNSDKKVAIVTGAGAGIGRAIALKLASEGYAVAIVDVEEERAHRVTQEIRECNAQAEAIACDVGKKTEAFRMVQETVRLLGEVELLVNNAGIVRLGPLADFSEDLWRELFRVNVDGVFFCCQAVLPSMVDRNRGNIVNIASWNGKLGAPNFGAYSATKAAVISLTQSLAREVASVGIRVNAVCPGIIGDTPMREQVQQEGKAYGLPPAEQRAKTIPMGRLGRPEEIANAVVFLASDKASYMTGQAINVTGGLWLH
ncbi:MAG: SDR family oxidoreductase [Deltaproteobacteria bacterium]|nr:SDR family oxidoreductase [Deltaproteobacteria bacterium]